MSPGCRTPSSQELRLEGIVIDGRETPVTDSLVIPPDTQHIELRYAALTYRPPAHFAEELFLEALRQGVVITPAALSAAQPGAPSFKMVYSRVRKCPGFRAAFVDACKWRDVMLEIEREHVLNYFNRVGRVRRALANVPTYMMFDDHDVTDDWNLTARHRRRTLESPLGGRLILNAISAATVSSTRRGLPSQ